MYFANKLRMQTLWLAYSFNYVGYMNDSNSKVLRIFARQAVLVWKIYLWEKWERRERTQFLCVQYICSHMSNDSCWRSDGSNVFQLWMGCGISHHWENCWNEKMKNEEESSEEEWMNERERMSERMSEWRRTGVDHHRRDVSRSLFLRHEVCVS